ncbi:hypothetical protein BJI67_09085 [Acidihalobacter aeolianus]|uniref:AAA domain-containing protein n=2 Tax=Acidihalobacter aeolianus TaxID=2792603 RepID=A0A1D8K896_9GAMM|nr:hypothetical protein BJI67_09085 [Acidihalobacter aeolianus]
MNVSQPARAKVIAVTSGKGGVGKTNISVNLSVALSSRRRQVCLFDADTNQANVNVLLGLHPALTLEHLLSGDHEIEEILVKAPGNISIIPAASGIAAGSDLDEAQRGRLAAALDTLERNFDYLIVDTAAGSSSDVIFFLRAAALILLVITPEPTSLTNAFSLIRVMRREGITTPIQVIVNQVTDAHEFRAVYRRFHGAVQKYLHTQVETLGHIVTDDTIGSAVRAQRPVIFMRYDAPASLCFYTLAQQLDRLVTDLIPVTSGSLSQAVHLSAGPVQPTSDMMSDISPCAPHTEALFSQLLEAIRSLPEMEQDSFASGIGALINNFAQRYGSLPFPLDRTLYQYLEIAGYPADLCRSLVLTLENLYERREHKPLRDIESSVAKLMADAHGDEARMSALSRHVIDSFHRQFDHPPPIPESAIIDSILQGRHTLQTLNRIQRAIFKILNSESDTQENATREAIPQTERNRI